ncbi:MAG: low molecular weight phosphotyrosine protein phosphatase [Gammaproteobacteria bacterium]|nr:low molecular weight phosphotyrosine protein phosphatase [Gammaproteobacteria bacterium]
MKDKDQAPEPVVKILFVCLGNICRSPLAQGVFEKQAETASVLELIHIDSAGTHAYHIGELPDPRSMSIASTNNIDLSSQRARKVHETDFETFDYILAMDQDNYANLYADCPEQYRERLHLFLNFAPHLDLKDVPDPYYGGNFGFERVYDLVFEASEGLIKTLLENELADLESLQADSVTDSNSD